MESLQKAIDIVGGVGVLASAVGVVQGAVSNWKKRGNIPAEYCPAIERATHGKVTCEALRPDVDWAYLRGSAHCGSDQKVA